MTCLVSTSMNLGWWGHVRQTCWILFRNGQRCWIRARGLTLCILTSKTFGMVPHKRLIIKLGAYGLKGSILQWLQHFLYDRQQQVRVGRGISSWTQVTSGILQGSVLGPVLFVSELPRLLHHRVKMFADDMKLYRSVSGSRDVQLLQQDLDILSQWADTWLLKFNISKCHVMHCWFCNPRDA